MKKFLKYCILFSCPFILAVPILEIALRQVSNPYKYKYEWMQQHAEDVELLIFGSSHTFYGIRPEFFKKKAFSLANVSQGTRQDLFLLKYWANRYKNLKTIIVPISFFSWFGHGLEYGSESYRCRYYRIYMDCDLYPQWSLYNLELSDYRTAQGKIDKLKSHVNDPGCDLYGWGTTYLLKNKNMDQWNDGTEADAAVKRHTAASWEYIDTNYDQMKEMATFCKSHNIQMILITTPCWYTYYNNLNQKQLAKMYELNHQFQRDFGVQYIDYLKDSRFEADDFYDSNHLSDAGAIKFTKILSHDIRQTNEVKSK